MGKLDKQGVVTMQELLVSSLVQTDALTKLLIEKELITETEFTQKLSAERARYQAMLRKMGYLLTNVLVRLFTVTCVFAFSSGTGWVRV